VQVPDTAPLQLPLVHRQPALVVKPEPLHRPVRSQLRSPVQLAPPSSRLLVPQLSRSRHHLAALLPVTPDLRPMCAALAIPDEPGRLTRSSQRAHRNKTAVGPQVLPDLAHRVPRPGRRVSRTATPPAPRHAQRQQPPAVLAALVPASLKCRRVQPASESARLSLTAHRLLPQAESQLRPTTRAANAGRRLFADHRCPAPVQVRGWTELVVVGLRHPPPPHLPPGNRPNSRLGSPLAAGNPVWFDPSRAHHHHCLGPVRKSRLQAPPAHDLGDVPLPIDTTGDQREGGSGTGSLHFLLRHCDPAQGEAQARPIRKRLRTA